MISVVSIDSPKPLSEVDSAAVKDAPPTTIFKSRLPDIQISADVPLHKYCFENMSAYSERPCLIAGETGKSYTYEESKMLCRKTAEGLMRIGVGKGDTVMILLHNCPEFVFSFMGASMAGAASTTANPFYTPTDIFKQMRNSAAKVVITMAVYVEKLRKDENLKVGEDFKVVTIDDPPEGCLKFSEMIEGCDGVIDIDSEIDPDSPVALPFSSGTTGLPKGVVLTHRGQVTSVAQQVDGENPNLYLTSDDVALCVLPLFHIFSLNSVLFCSLRTGTTVLLMQKFEIKTMLELIQKYKVTMAAVVPPLVLALAKNPIVAEYDLSSIRLVLSGAAPLGKELEESLQSRLPQAVLGQGYGMTEAGPVLSMSPGFAKTPFPTKSGSVGTVVRNAELMIIDPENGCSLGYNQPGEICVRGRQIMKGYLNDSASTENTIDVDGWLHTGDIGYVDDDDEVFVVDRVKEIIKYKGFQVPPAEIESLLVNHPSIVDAAVIPLKDTACGELPVAFVVLSNGSELTEEAIKEYIAKQVVFYKKIHKVYFVTAIPKSPAGKILRKDLRAKLAAESISS